MRLYGLRRRAFRIAEPSKSALHSSQLVSASWKRHNSRLGRRGGGPSKGKGGDGRGGGRGEGADRYAGDRLQNLLASALHPSQSPNELF